MYRMNLLPVWPYLTLPAVVLVLLAVAVLAGSSDGDPCAGHRDHRVVYLGGHCAVLVPSR
jgi:hypothetical protein